MTAELRKPFLKKQVIKLLSDAANLANYVFDFGMSGPVQVVKFISYESDPPEKYIETLVSDKRDIVHAIFSPHCARTFSSTYSRRITENTKGCIIRILSARLHLMPSIAINPSGIISVDLDASTPMLATTYADIPEPESKLVPVLYITKFAYIGADGTDLLGDPHMLRQSMRVRAAIRDRYAVAPRSAEGVSPESPKTEKFKTPTQLRTPNQPVANTQTEIATNVGDGAREENQQTQEISVSDFATQPPADWTTNSSIEGAERTEIEQAAVERDEPSFGSDRVDTSMELSRSEVVAKTGLDDEDAEDVPVPLEVPYRDGFLKIAPTIMSTTVFYRPLGERPNPQQDQQRGSHRGVHSQSVDHVSSTPPMARSSSPICAWSQSPPPYQRPPPPSTTQTTPNTPKSRVSGLEPVEHGYTQVRWSPILQSPLQVGRLRVPDGHVVQVQDSQSARPNEIPSSPLSGFKSGERAVRESVQTSPLEGPRDSECSSPIAYEGLYVATTDAPFTTVNTVTAEERPLKRKRRHLVPRFTEFDRQIDLESLLLEDRRKFKELINREGD
ncbi:hypothetical protein POJ06DRAFT_212741 [Lipomyces tetrasporus]|uniref:Telomere replication protein EST3 n=1 Tax=Lipomyces tetrasporus TaxID=54092 RepID=A0AAD7QNG3_9ASCO|nr:uncharacterized protein POJ06DRAFT_212741 [Lipomyces tetrasporus]KAJ8098622.1 hypothetical protein POJ06DRAFT_212741 [Lipomyces tetrasporus]